MAHELIVTEKAQRPADMNGKCFYCNQPIGKPHKSDCVLVKKMVKVRMTVEYEICVPNNWDSSMVEFHRNDGTWCSDNAIEELETLAKSDGCLCHLMRYECLSDKGDAFLGE